MESYTSRDVNSSTETRSSPVFSSFSSRTPSETTLATSRSISPFHPDMSSLKDLFHNPDFIPIDQVGKKPIPELGPRPVFESPRPAPQPPRSKHKRSSSISLAESNQSTLSTDAEDDICEEAEDFLQFLSKAAFMAAERRSSSIRRPSILSGASVTESPRNSGLVCRPLSGNSTLDFVGSRPSSLIVDSRRTSLALRRGSSGVLPPILQEEPISAPILEHESIQQSPMQTEDHITKLLSQVRMSSDFSATTAITAPTPDDDSVFQARKQSSFDFSDLEVVLSHAKNPILIQLHQVYTAQFELMASKIDSLTNEMQILKSQMNPPEPDHFIDRQISLDVVSTTRSESMTRHVSRQLSQVVTGSATITEHRPAEIPFWKVSLQTAGEEWDGGAMEAARKRSMRCVSPMTLV